MTDTTPAIIHDHPYRAPDGEPWGRCAELVYHAGAFPEYQRCGLAEAAHATTATPYLTDARREQLRIRRHGLGEYPERGDG